MKKVLDIEHEVLEIWNQGENSSNKGMLKRHLAYSNFCFEYNLLFLNKIVLSDFMFDEEFHTDRSTIPATDAASIGKKSIHYDLSKRLTSSANVKDIKKLVLCFAIFLSVETLMVDLLVMKMTNRSFHDKSSQKNFF